MQGRPERAGRLRPLPSHWGWLAWFWLISLYSVVVLGWAAWGGTWLPYRLSPEFVAWPTNVLARDGSLLAQFFVEYRRPLTLTDVPAHTLQAVVLAEDRRFFEHHGLDGRGIARAAWANLRAGRVVQGGSTITQQLIRLHTGDRRRSVVRKLAEALLAVRAEHTHSKRELLTLYLNGVYFGGGMYGLSAAAYGFFRKPVSALTPAESALLAGLIRAPGTGNPRRHPAVARRRQLAVLQTMQRSGSLSPAVAARARTESLHLAPPLRHPWRAPYAVEAVRQELLARYGAARVYRGGLTVVTTVDPRLQAVAEQTLRQAVATGRGRRVTTGALVALDPRTGEIRALVGGPDFWTSPFNRALQAHRQPGSAFKAFVYQAAFERGHLLLDAILDAPVQIGEWTPSNYGAAYAGTVTLETALALSLNSAAVRLIREVGPGAVVAAAHRAGIHSPLPASVTLALGTAEVTPLEMAQAFGTYANGGQATTPHLIRRITAGQTLVYHYRGTPQPAVDPAVAYYVTEGLQAVIARGTGRRARLDRPTAGKTGTTNAYRDAWFVGFTPSLCAAVWLGRDDCGPMAGVAGGSLPAQTWAAFMRDALAGHAPEPFTPPAGLLPVRLCTLSHLQAVPPCPSTRIYYLPIDRWPPECDAHLWVRRMLCEDSGLLPTPACPRVHAQTFRYDEVLQSRCTMQHTVAIIPLGDETAPSSSALPNHPTADAPSLPTPSIPERAPTAPPPATALPAPPAPAPQPMTAPATDPTPPSTMPENPALPDSPPPNEESPPAPAGAQEDTAERPD
jgi:penicillin-binding protein 1A